MTPKASAVATVIARMLTPASPRTRATRSMRPGLFSAKTAIWCAMAPPPAAVAPLFLPQVLDAHGLALAAREAAVLEQLDAGAHEDLAAQIVRDAPAQRLEGVQVATEGVGLELGAHRE